MLKIIVPAAGEGTRLRPYTLTTPKVILPVAGKPILGHIFEQFLPLSPEDIMVIVGRGGEKIERYLKGNFSVPLRILRQKEPLGIAHAVFQAREYCHGSSLLILLGDTILEMELSDLIDGENYLGVRKVDDPRRFGIAECSNDYIVRVIEKPRKPKSNLALVGLYYFRDATPLFSAIAQLIHSGKKTKGEYQITDAIQMMIEDGVEIRPFEIAGWLDCGTIQTFLSTNRYLLEKRHHAGEHKDNMISPPVFIADSATVENSIIGPYASLSENVHIENSIIKNSIIVNNASLKNSVVLDTMVGENDMVENTTVLQSPPT